MKLIKLLVNYIEKNKIDYNFIANGLELEEQELKRMLYWDEDLLLSELEEIMNILDISYSNLSDGLIAVNNEFSFETTVSRLMENLSQEERSILEQLLESVELDPNNLNSIQVNKSYIN